MWKVEEKWRAHVFAPSSRTPSCHNFGCNVVVPFGGSGGDMLTMLWWSFEEKQMLTASPPIVSTYRTWAT